MQYPVAIPTTCSPETCSLLSQPCRKLNHLFPYSMQRACSASCHHFNLNLWEVTLLICGTMVDAKNITKNQTVQCNHDILVQFLSKVGEFSMSMKTNGATNDSDEHAPSYWNGIILLYTISLPWTEFIRLSIPGDGHMVLCHYIMATYSINGVIYPILVPTQKEAFLVNPYRGSDSTRFKRYEVGRTCNNHYSSI